MRTLLQRRRLDDPLNCRVRNDVQPRLEQRGLRPLHRRDDAALGRLVDHSGLALGAGAANEAIAVLPDLVAVQIGAADVVVEATIDLQWAGGGRFGPVERVERTGERAAPHVVQVGIVGLGDHVGEACVRRVENERKRHANVPRQGYSLAACNRRRQPAPGGTDGSIGDGATPHPAQRYHQEGRSDEGSLHHAGDRHRRT